MSVSLIVSDTNMPLGQSWRERLRGRENRKMSQAYIRPFGEECLNWNHQSGHMSAAIHLQWKSRKQNGGWHNHMQEGSFDAGSYV